MAYPGRIFLNIIRGFDIVSADIIGKVDPFIKIIFGKTEKKTKKMKNNKDPVYNERML
jgi:Ca2+-dependent lipid-binding protein